MPNPSPDRRTLSALLIVVLTALFCATASAEVKMEVFPGFDGAMKAFVWSPVAVKLTNPDDRAFEGELTVRQDSSGGRKMPTCAARVNLPGNSTKLYHVYLRLQQYGGDVRVVLAKGSRVAAAKRFPASSIEPPDLLVVSLGERASRLAFLSGEKIPATAGTGPGATTPPSGVPDATIHAAAIPHAMLSDRPAAYQGVDVMIMSGLGATPPDPKALKALGMWVAGGGTLVVSAGPDFRKFQHEFFDDLLPVTITGASSVPSLNSIASMGGEAVPGGAAAVATSAPKPGISTQVIREGETPVYAERRYGSGRVVFLAFDHRASPFRDWNGQTEFWKAILTSRTPGPLVREDMGWAWDSYGHNPYGRSFRNPTSLSEVVEHNQSVRTPSFSIIALYLLAYVVFLVPLNYMYLKKRRRMELAWITTPAIVLAFTLGAYAIGYTMKGGSIAMRTARVIEGGSDCRYARTISAASLFSPSRRSYDVAIDDPYAIAQCIPQEESEPIPTAYVAEKTTIEKIGMAMWSSRDVESVGGTDLGGAVTANLTISDSRLSGTVTNSTRFDLKDCTVYFMKREHTISDLPRGRTATLGSPPKPVVPGAPSGGQMGIRELQARLKWMVSQTSSDTGSPILVGTVKPESAYTLDGGRAKVTSAACCIFRLDVETQGVRVFDPSSMTARMVSSQNARPAEETPPPGSGAAAGTGGPGLILMNVSGGGSFVVTYQIPVSGPLELSSLKLVQSSSHPNGGSGPARVEYMLSTRSGERVRVDVSGGGGVPNPQRFLQAGNRITLKVQSSDSQDVQVNVGIVATGK